MAIKIFHQEIITLMGHKIKKTGDLQRCSLMCILKQFTVHSETCGLSV